MTPKSNSPQVLTPADFPFLSVATPEALVPVLVPLVALALAQWPWLVGAVWREPRKAAASVCSTLQTLSTLRTVEVAFGEQQ
jgi:hypothetical protein